MSSLAALYVDGLLHDDRVHALCFLKFVSSASTSRVTSYCFAWYLAELLCNLLMFVVVMQEEQNKLIPKECDCCSCREHN